jgi:uncharacterized membrane protein
MTTATQQSSQTERRWEDIGEPTRFEWDQGPERVSPHQAGRTERTARGLGWFSIGLGLAEVAAPRRMARLIGVEDDDTHRNILFAYGLREIASGLAILAGDRPTGAVWARVGGDLMDLAFLGRAMTSHRSERGKVALATAAVLGVTALDVMTGQRLKQQSDRTHASGDRRIGTGAIDVQQSITIGRPPEEIYRFWRDFQNLPRFMEHLESVQVIDERRSHWKVRAPAGSSVEWDASIVEDRPNEAIVWRSESTADVPNRGTVRFKPAPGNRGTEIHVSLQYEPPGGRLGALVAKLFGEEPAQQVNADLRRLKQVIETGEVVHSDASIHRGMHPAQPSAESAKARGER